MRALFISWRSWNRPDCRLRVWNVIWQFGLSRLPLPIFAILTKVLIVGPPIPVLRRGKSLIRVGYSGAARVQVVAWNSKRSFDMTSLSRIVNKWQAALMAITVVMAVGPASAQMTTQSVVNRSSSAAPGRVFTGEPERHVASRGYVPSHMRNTSSARTSSTMVYQESGVDEVIIPDTSAPVAVESVVGHSAGCASCGLEVSCGVDWSGQCDSCMMGGCGDCGSCNSCAARGCLIPCPQFALRRYEYFAGVQAFKGQPNRGRDGSFGFNAGLNGGFHLPCLTSDFFTGQFGLQTVQSNFYESPMTTEQRGQLFATAGFFRRVDYGLQGGVVADIAYNNWYTEMTVAQMRGQVSWVYEGGNELGFWFTTSIQNDINQITLATNQPVNNTETWEALNTYRAFYTHQLDCFAPGASATLTGGFSEFGDAIVGTDFFFPLNSNMSLDTGFMYLIPTDAAGVTGNINESWNVGINLTFYPRGLQVHRNEYTRPLFGVADNSTFLINNRR